MLGIFLWLVVASNTLSLLGTLKSNPDGKRKRCAEIGQKRTAQNGQREKRRQAQQKAKSQTGLTIKSRLLGIIFIRLGKFFRDLKCDLDQTPA